jgi:hypothetical protein
MQNQAKNDNNVRAAPRAAVRAGYHRCTLSRAFHGNTRFSVTGPAEGCRHLKEQRQTPRQIAAVFFDTRGYFEPVFDRNKWISTLAPRMPLP